MTVQGIVSRIVMARYAFASNKLLGIQIDAAINPGWRRYWCSHTCNLKHCCNIQ